VSGEDTDRSATPVLSFCGDASGWQVADSDQIYRSLDFAGRPRSLSSKDSL